MFSSRLETMEASGVAIPLLGPGDDPELEEIATAKKQLKNLMQIRPHGRCRSVDDYTKMSDAGRGSSGVVFQAKHTKTNEVVALKKISILKSANIDIDDYTTREIQNLKLLDHANVVKLKDVVVGQKLKSVFLVLEYCQEDLGKIQDELKMPFSQDLIKNMMSQLFSGLEHIHSHHIVHRDINPSNLLLNEQGVLKISDFGSSRICLPEANMTPDIGTAWYKAPELLFEFPEYSQSIDMWSAGCIMGELLQNKPLFSSENQMTIISKIIDLLGAPNDDLMPGYSRTFLSRSYNLVAQPFNMVNTVFSKFPPGCRDLLKSLLIYNPKIRFSAEKSLKSPYFTEDPKPCSNDIIMMDIMQRKMDI